MNGNTYKFDIFEDGIYRVSEVIKLKENIQEVTDETNPNRNSKYSLENTKYGRNSSSSNNESNRYDGTSTKASTISAGEQGQQGSNENGILAKTQSRNNRKLDNK